MRKFICTKWVPITIVMVMVIGFVMRLYCCYWGYPVPLHVDEPVVVEAAERMIENHTWLVDIYYRPDHFEIKCDAALFVLASKFIYHQPIAEAFSEHTMQFYMLARLFTTIVGTLLIPLVALLAGRMMKDAPKNHRDLTMAASAFLTGVSMVFVQHSAYATPDVVLTFFVVLFGYFVVRYLEDGKLLYLVLSAATVGVATTVKYPALILCLFIAGMVVYRSILVEHRPARILNRGFLSIAAIIVTILVIAPNLITDFENVYKAFMGESDGLVSFAIFCDNLRFYLESLCDFWGILSAVLTLMGILYGVRQRKVVYIVLAIGPIYVLCLATLSLHWIRWAIPMYPFFLILVICGLILCYDSVENLIKKDIVKKCIKVAVMIESGLIIINAFLTGASIVKFSKIPDIRLDVMAYWNENSLNKSNTLFEGGTPDEPYMIYRKIDSFSMREDKVVINRENAVKSYFCRDWSARNDNEGKKILKPSQARRYPIYNSLDTTYPIIAEFTVDGNYKPDKILIKNILNSLKYLKGHYSWTGNNVTIYDLKPCYIQMQSKIDGEYIYLGEDAGLHTSDEIRAHKWVVYNEDDGLTSIIFEPGNVLLASNGTDIRYAEMDEEDYVGWRIEEVGEYRAVIDKNGNALTAFDEKISLAPYDGSDAQLFRFVEE